MLLMPHDIPRMIDISLLNSDVTQKDLDEFVETERKARCICAFVMPCNMRWLAEQFQNDSDIHIGGVIGFPTGTDTTDSKLFQAKERLRGGADELDVVINIGWLKSGRYDDVLNELKQIVAIAEGHLVKVILEVTLLTDDEIRKGCELVVQSGADFVKTGTGSRPSPTTLHHVQVMQEAVAGRISMKAAGGIRNLDTFVDMVKCGVSRFGIGCASALSIIHEAEERYPDGIEI